MVADVLKKYSRAAGERNQVKKVEAMAVRGENGGNGARTWVECLGGGA